MKSLFLFLTLFTSLSAAAATTTANIHKGDLEVSGSMNLSADTKHFSTAYFNLDTTAQHFFADEFSAGLGASFYSYNSTTGISFGPILTKYLWVQDKIAPYVSLTPIYWSKFSRNKATYSTYGSVGVKFFITDSVAFGPALAAYHYWPKNGGSSNTTLALLGMFAIHL
ncbi:MAG: hypothetical protein ACXWQO_02335 [Bdellovibrionota bacterium]